MERLQELVTELRGNLPSCFVCRRTAAEVEIYQIYTCHHFLCKQCAFGASPSHDQCRGQKVDVDYAQLNRDRETMATALREFDAGNRPMFPSVFTAYFRLVSQVSKFGVDSPHPAEEEKSLPPQVPANSSLWLCSCGVSNPAAAEQCSTCFYFRTGALQPVGDQWTCSCGAFNPLTKKMCHSCKKFNVSMIKRTCTTCKQQQCICVKHPSNIWTCVHCRYEYNTDENALCSRCKAPMPGLEQ